jgi:epoxyqueuosine reductase
VDPLLLTRQIRLKAEELGFGACRFAKAEPLVEEARHLEEWLSRGHHGSMAWMEHHFDKRVDPTKLVEGAKTVVCLMAGYHFQERWESPTSQVPRIAKYAQSRDYHKVLKKACHKIINHLHETISPDIHARAFVDSAPVMERAWAQRSGIGWLGKNGNILNRTHGSWFLLAEIILDQETIPDQPMQDHCGSCTACIDACPTEAIVKPSVIDSRKCISYFDICQDVCPWNRKAEPHHMPGLETRESFSPIPSLREWGEFTEDTFFEQFQGSPLMRAGWKRLTTTARAINNEHRSSIL